MAIHLHPRILAMQRLRAKEELARQAAILGANKQKGIMSSLPTNPRALAMARLREKEELARQAAILSSEKQKGIMSSLPTNLGSIGQFISDDNNDLDNLSFSTDKGLKVNLQNNRNKDSIPTHKVLEDFSWYKGNLGKEELNKMSTDEMIDKLHPRITAMDNNRAHEAWGVAQQIKEEWKDGIKNWGTRDTRAIDAFIETNSAQPLYQIPDRTYSNGNVDSTASDYANFTGTGVQTNGVVPPVVNPNPLYSIPEQPYGTIGANNVASDYANFEGIIETPQQYTQSDFEPYYLPLSDGEDWYVESREEEEFLKNSTIAERDAYTSLNEKDADAFLANWKPSETGYEEPLPAGMDALYPELDTELSTQMSLLEQEDRNVFVTDDAKMIKTDLTEYEEAILDGDMDLARDIREQGHADNHQRFEELKLLYPNQALTSQYFPDVDYSHPNLIAQLKQKNDENLAGKFDIYNPTGSTIGYADSKENANKYSVGGDTGLLEYAGVSLSDDEIANVNATNAIKLDDEALILDDIYNNKYGFTPEDAMIDQQEGSELLVDENLDEPLYQIPDRTYTDIAEDGIIDSGITSDYADYANVLSEDPEVAEVQIAEEEVETQTAAAELETSSNESNEAKTAADEVIDGDDDDEVKESKLSNIFGSLKDIFGVDNKSLLRAFVKYVGGRLFGLSSGKAAAFAWKGIEQDMAISAAKGAEARKWQDNMDEYDKMYDEAIAAGDTEGAERIFRQRDEYSGKDKTEAEKYYDNIEFLEGKLTQAIADGDKPEMVKAITAQLKRYREGGIDGTTTIKQPYDLNIQDENGNEKRVLARNGVNGREVQNQDGSWTPLTEYKHPDPDFGKIIHSNAVVKSESGAAPFKMAGQRYDQSEDEKFEAEIGAIDADLEAGKIDEVEAYNRKSVVQNNNNNRNEYGEIYDKKIPHVTYISDTGVVYFPQFLGTEKTSAYQLAEGTRGLAKLKAIQANPKAMALVDKWTAQWDSIATSKMEEYSAIAAYISKNYRANPLQQAYYMGMLELTTSKLRRDTGAAYNMKEMFDTMTRYTNYTDTSADVTEMKLAGAEVDLETIAGMTRSGQYWIGVLDGTYRPSDAWQRMMGSIYTMMETEGVYTSVGADGDGGSTRNFEDEFPG
jgi:hypothetical protein